jgi:hypothetical protein
MYIIGCVVLTAVLRIRIRIRIKIHRIHVFLDLLDPSNIKQKSKKTLDFSCFVTSFYRILRNYVYCDIVIMKLRLSQHRNYKITPIATSNFELCVHLETS